MKARFKKSLTLICAALALCLLAVAVSRSPAAAQSVSYLPYEEARSILEAMRDIAPEEIKNAKATEAVGAWAKWAARRDAEIRARLLQGDEDSVIHFMLFGTSFTRRPRLSLLTLTELNRQMFGVESPETNADLERIKLRADDFIQGIATPGNNERLLFARRLITAKGYDLKSASGRAKVKDYLLSHLKRLLIEQVGYAKTLEAAQALGDPSAEFVERSKLYRERGLSSDTSLMPNYAIEKTLAAMKSNRLLTAGSVRRVAIIGPGLDFTDKQDGYDFYPQQTIQPFAVIDALMRLGLAQAKDLRLTTLDLSPRINAHLNRARQQAQKGSGYVVQLPSDSQWNAELTAYWSDFGKFIGTPTTPVPAPKELREVKIRAVKIRPAVVSLISSQDVNIVLQQLRLAEAEKFDLIIATNILVYYDVFEQCLALANVEKMLRPGGFLLSNNALLELPGSRMRSAGYETVVYSDRQADGDHIVYYQRAVQ